MGMVGTFFGGRRNSFNAAATDVVPLVIEPATETPPADVMGPVLPYNAPQPFVLVDISCEIEARGDSHGFIGLGRRLAEKTGGKYRFLDKFNLAQFGLPQDDIDTQNLDEYRASNLKRVRQLERFFASEGYPDFILTRGWSTTMDCVDGKAAGLMLNNINECITSTFMRSRMREPDFDVFVPHHLTPEVFAHEGRRFAEEFADLPRPFIGINLIEKGAVDIGTMTRKLGDLKHAYPEATFFICCTHRTDPGFMNMFYYMLKQHFTGEEDRYPVIKYDHKYDLDHHDKSDYWNPYIGMLDQADHIVQIGVSRSILSESLAAGKTVHMFDLYRGSYNYCKAMGHYQKGEPLVSPPVKTPDRTSEVAEAIILKHAELKKEFFSHPAMHKQSYKCF